MLLNASRQREMYLIFTVRLGTPRARHYQPHWVVAFTYTCGYPPESVFSSQCSQWGIQSYRMEENRQSPFLLGLLQKAEICSRANSLVLAISLILGSAGSSPAGMLSLPTDYRKGRRKRGQGERDKGGVYGAMPNG